MPGLTTAEKEHWRARIAARIDKKIEAIAAGEPNLLDRVQREARQRALQSLGLADWQAGLDDIGRQRAALAKQEADVQRAMLAHVRGVSLDEIGEYEPARTGEQEVRQAISHRQAVHADELLAECETGRKIIDLRREQENLDDAIWLTTACAQVKVLWFKVAELLGDQQTRLQIEALAIVPISGE